MIKAFDPSRSVSSLLTLSDFLVIFFFLLLSWWLGKIAGARQRAKNNDSEYLLMAKGLGLPLFVATLTSTWYGGIFGVTQIAFENGVYSFFTQGLFWYLAYLIFALFLSSKIRQNDVKSLPEFIGQKFGPRARKLSALILFFHALPITYAISLGLVISLLSGWHLIPCMAAGVIFVAAYSSFGGFRSVVLTDGLQFIVMFAAVMLVLLFSIFSFGGLEFLRLSLPEHYFSWHSDKNIAHTLVWLFSACSTTFVHPAFYQRCLAAKSDRVATMGILIAIFFWFLFDICTSFGGMYARVFLPNAPSNRAYFLYGLELLPLGLRGFFVAGIMATILSTMDSFLFSAATTVSYDLLRPDKNFKKSRHVIAILTTGMVTILIATMLSAKFEKIWLFLEGLFSVCVVIPSIVAILSKKVFAEGDFIWPALAALTVFLLANIANSEMIMGIPPFYLGHMSAALLMCARTAKVFMEDKYAETRR